MGILVPQSDTIISPEVTYKQVLFVTKDSVFKSTIFIKPSGEYYFDEGFTDENYNDSVVFYDFSQKGVVKVIDYSYRFISGIDTIYNYFPGLKLDSTDKSSKLLYEALNMSYILSKLEYESLTALDSYEILLIVPNEELNSRKTYQCIFIDMQGEVAFLKSIKTGHIRHKELGYIKQNSVVLKEKHVNKISKYLNKVPNELANTCFDDFNPMVLRYKVNDVYKSKFFSYNCARFNSEWKHLKKISNFILYLDR